MKRALFVLALFAFVAPAQAQHVGGPGTVKPTSPLTCDNKPLSFHRHRAHKILEREYAVTYYSTHATADRDSIADMQRHKRCILDRGMRRDLGEKRHDLAAFQRRRIAATPYAGNGVYWAIPAYVVECESHYDYTPIGSIPEGGAYGLLASWHVRGGEVYAQQANWAPTWAQDLIADVAWRAGDSWACA